MVEMTLSIIVVSLPGLKPLLKGSSSKKSDSINENHYTEEPKSNIA